MAECTAVTLEVINPQGTTLTVEVLEPKAAQLEVDLQAGPAIVDVFVASLNEGSGGTDTETVQTIAAGSTLGLQQELLALQGQPALTVLAVGATNTGRVQGVSLGAGNVIEVYASGTAFTAGSVLYREFMELGEPICLTGLSDGAIITSTQGFYGISEQADESQNEYGPMPLFSYGLSFDFSFLYGFRDFDQDDGLIHVINGPLDNRITLTLGDGTVVLEQQEIPLAPWEKTVLSGNGAQEYILRGTNRMMAGVQAGMIDGSFKDNRLIMPLTHDGITWPRKGFLSAPFDDTLVDYYVRDGISGSLNDGAGVSPGSPVDIALAPPIGTGANDIRYRPNGATRFRAKGLISAFSGADGFGSEATPLMPVTAMAQVTAQPFIISDANNGGYSGIALASCCECEAKVYEYDAQGEGLVLKYDVALTRQSVSLDSPEKQYHPAAAAISNETAHGAIELQGALKPGVIVSTAPIMVIAQNGDPDLQPEIRSQNGTTTASIKTSGDETLMLGWIPDQLRAQVTTDANGFLRRRQLDGAGLESWPLA
ncbi:MAG: hypothetical protein MJH08_00180 [Hyphomicrobiales bacterium]|nr:hypothetical protein [Hyphomicrobiales bacterium]